MRLFRNIGNRQARAGCTGNPDGHKFHENIALALQAIWGRANDAENCINYRAEQVGCNWRDPASERRYAAAREAHKELYRTRRMAEAKGYAP